MNILPWILTAALAGAVLPGPAPSEKKGAAASGDEGDWSGPSDEEASQFDTLLSMGLQSEGLSAKALEKIGAAARSIVGGAGAGPQPTYQEQQREIAAEFDKTFGPRAYQKMKDFSNRCDLAAGCNRLATADIFTGAGNFVALEKDVKKKVLERESPEYERRGGEIKGKMKKTLETLRPKDRRRGKFEGDLLAAAEPIITKIFTPEERLRFAQENAVKSDSAPAYALLGKVFSAGGPPAKARAAFNSALEKDPGHQQALSGRAQANFNLGDYPAAVEDARAALALDPEDKTARATLMLSHGRGAAQAPPIDQAPSPAPVSAGAPAEAGVFASASATPAMIGRSEDLASAAKRSLGLGEPRDALAFLEKAVRLNPRNAQALSLASMTHNRLGEHVQAAAAADAGLKLAPNSTALLDSKAFALNHLKDYRGALEAAERSLAINPRDAMAHFNKAAALGGLGDRKGMLASLKEAAALEPRFVPILEAAVTMPEDGDILLLFPGAQAAAPQAAPAAAAGAPPLPPRWPIPAAAALAAAFLAGLGVLAARFRRRPPLPAPPRVPHLLAGKYQVGTQIGFGGMGVVYEGKDLSLERAVAVKRMREEIRWDQRERQRFIAEAKVVAKLKHANIVEIHAIVEEDGEVYLIFEFVAGKTLHEAISAQTRLPFARARDLFRGVASALDYAQGRGIIHRDLKPANIMIDPEGRARVMDFGIARLTEEALSRHSSARSVAGTPPYMAPEQEQGIARRESDIYSMAICLYEAVTGKLPFAGSGAGILMNKLNKAYPPASTLAAGLPPGLDAVFARALDPDPDKRFSSAGDFLKALESL